MVDHDIPAGEPIDEHQAADLFEELIRRRAYELSQAEDTGDPEYNWLRAERELQALSGHRPQSADEGQDD